MSIISNLSRQYFIQFFVHINVHLIHSYVQLVYCLILLLYFILFRQGQPCCETAKGPFKYYVIMFLTFLDPPTHFFDDLQYCKLSKIAIF